MKEEQRVHAATIRAAIKATVEDLELAHSAVCLNQLERHLRRLLEIEFAVLAAFKFDASEQEIE